ncbi:membrane protein [Bacillus sp. JCM 19046]|nr:membrane protein [Bacillus sp. JCM 19046]
MSGFFIYWLGWLAWIVCTFLMKKTELRAICGFTILALLLFIPLKVQLGGVSVSLGFLLCLFVSYFYLGKFPWKRLFYHIFTTSCIAISYICMNELIRIDPVVLIFDRNILLTIPPLLVAFFLTRGVSRSIILALGLLHGEVLLHLYRSNLTEAVIGSYEFFDVLAITVTVSSCYWIFSQVIRNWGKRQKAKANLPLSIPNRIDKHA